MNCEPIIQIFRGTISPSIRDGHRFYQQTNFFVEKGVAQKKRTMDNRNKNEWKKNWNKKRLFFYWPHIFLEQTVLLNDHSVRKKRNKWKINDNFENAWNQFFKRLNKTNKMGCSGTMNEQIEKSRTCPSLPLISIELPEDSLTHSPLHVAILFPQRTLVRILSSSLPPPALPPSLPPPAQQPSLPPPALQPSLPPPVLMDLEDPGRSLKLTPSLRDKGWWIYPSFWLQGPIESSLS